jgi:hypothetical protein
LVESRDEVRLYFRINQQVISMKKSNPSIKEVEQAIRSFEVKDQKKLLNDLPKLLKLPAAESAFGFWDNSEDQIYDSL